MIKITQFKSRLIRETPKKNGFLYIARFVVNSIIFLNGVGIYNENNKMRVIPPIWTLSSRGKSKQIPFFLPVGKGFDKAVCEAWQKETGQKAREALNRIEEIKKKRVKTKKEKAVLADRKAIEILRAKTKPPELIENFYSIKENDILI